MSQIATIGRDQTPAQLALIQRTVAKDCDRDEFDHFMSVARSLRLDPLRKQICALVFSKNDPKKRSMSIIVQIDGFRVIAARQSDYRPMETAPLVETSEDAKNPDTNPLGIVRAEVRLWKKYGEQWFPVAGEAYWDEFAPIEREWIECDDGKRRPLGKATLAANWKRMPHVMISKVAEAQALRRGWPDDLSGVYAEEELAKAVVIDVASEVVADYEESQRLRRIGADAPGITFQFGAGNPLEHVALSKLTGRVVDFVRAIKSRKDMAAFQEANRVALQEFWARSPSEALEVKKEMERALGALAEADDFPGDRK